MFIGGTTMWFKLEPGTFPCKGAEIDCANNAIHLICTLHVFCYLKIHYLHYTIICAISCMHMCIYMYVCMYVCMLVHAIMTLICWHVHSITIDHVRWYNV